MITINNNLVTSDSGMIVCRKSNGACAKSHMALPGDTVDGFEELEAEAVPAYTESEYKVKVAELVHERYSIDDEAAIMRKLLKALIPQAAELSDGEEREASAQPPFDAEKAMAEYVEYDAYAERCKAAAPQAIAEDKARMALAEKESEAAGEEETLEEQ